MKTVREAPVAHELSSSGRPLPEPTRRHFGASLGFDFGEVRVHDDARAAASAEALGAVAYTAGRDVVFGASEYRPETAAGRALLGHELAHVVQQAGAAGSGRAACEAEADQVGARPEARHVIRERSGPVLQRKRRPSAVEVPDAAAAYDDRARAVEAVDAFFRTLTERHNFRMRAADRGVTRAQVILARQDSSRLTANIVYQVVRVILGILPELDAVKALFKLLENVKDPKLLKPAFVVLQRTAAGTSNALQSSSGGGGAVLRTLDSVARADAMVIDLLEARHAEIVAVVNGLARIGAYPEGLEDLTRRTLGPPERFIAMNDHFEPEIELAVYRAHCIEKVVVTRNQPLSLATTYTRYGVRGLKDPAADRIIALDGELGHVANASIDGRGTDERTVELVKILLSWGVKLDSVPSVDIHTGNDLQQPYVGERFKEAR